MASEPPIRPLVAPNINMARSSAVVSASVLVGSVFGGLLALLIAVIVGETPQTDGFLAAYSAYLVFILFGTNLRVALLPHFGSVDDEVAFRERAREIVGQLAGASAVVVVAIVLASPLLGRLLVPGAPAEAQEAAFAGVAILAVAAWTQIWSAALASVLAATERFVVSAVLYAAAGGAYFAANCASCSFRTAIAETTLPFSSWWMTSKSVVTSSAENGSAFSIWIRTISGNSLGSTVGR